MPARFPVGASYYGPEMTSAQLPSSPAVLPGTHAVRQQAFEQLRERAITLRRSGRSRREIKEVLGITSNATLDRSRELREQGLGYEEIAGALGVSKSPVSLWVRDMPRPMRLSYEESRKGRLRVPAGSGPRSGRSGKPNGRRSGPRLPPRSAACPRANCLSPARLLTGAKAPRASRPDWKSVSSSSTATLG